MENQNTAGIDLDSLTRYYMGAMDMQADLSGKYVKIDDVRELLARRAEPSVAADERALFEANWPEIHKHGIDHGWRGIALAAWKARAALASPAVPEGYKLVPLKPTTEMRAAKAASHNTTKGPRNE